jgi:glycogen operon protein
VGNFPVGWTEWNGRYRDSVRDYWRGEGGLIDELGFRLTGSSDLYGASGRSPRASVNFVTCHDGFTLHDLVSYNDKHNEANLEDNRDGEEHNRSWNCGAEGPSDDAQVLQLREQQKRNLLASVLFSQGVPMLLAGDEMGRTQQGNNNAYCQDNELSWMSWQPDAAGRSLLEFTRRAIALSRHPVFCRRGFLAGRDIRGTGVKDITWLSPEGGEMSEHDWHLGYARCVGMQLAGDAIIEPDPRGRRIVDDDFVLLLNAHHEPIAFRLPPGRDAAGWEPVLDTAREAVPPAPRRGEYPLAARSLAVLTQRRTRR